MFLKLEKATIKKGKDLSTWKISTCVTEFHPTMNEEKDLAISRISTYVTEFHE